MMILYEYSTVLFDIKSNNKIKFPNTDLNFLIIGSLTVDNYKSCLYIGSSRNYSVYSLTEQLAGQGFSLVNDGGMIKVTNNTPASLICTVFHGRLRKNNRIEEITI